MTGKLEFQNVFVALRGGRAIGNLSILPQNTRDALLAQQARLILKANRGEPREFYQAVAGGAT